MNFGHPELLWLLLLLPLCAAGRLLLARRADANADALGAARPDLVPGRRAWLVAGKRLAAWLGLVLLVVAAAAPRWGGRIVHRASRGANLMVLIDCSNSMRAEDCWPDRIGTARRKALDLLRSAPENRIGLMPFARSPALRCPLTGDFNAVRQMIEDCNPDLFPREFQGTGIGRAVSQAVTLLCNDRTRGQAILVISDGADPDEEAVDRAVADARAEGIPVYGLLVGDPERRATIEVDGKPVAVPPVRDTLDRLRKETGGLLVSMTNDDRDVTAITAHIARHIDLMDWEEKQKVIDSERYYWCAAAALLLLALAQLLPCRIGAVP